jgi:hypothetical protein
MWHFEDKPVSSGVFGVLKPKKQKVRRSDGTLSYPHRLIINLVPPNSLHKNMNLGENDLLPSEAQWNAFHLLPLQLILMSARDRRCFFYIFRMPKPWTAIFTLCVKVLWRDLDVDRDGSTLLGVRVCGMGWKYATAVTQAAHRKMVIVGYQLPCSISQPGGLGELPECCEVRRDRGFPVTGCAHTTTAWSIYIDNLDVWETYEGAEAYKRLGSVSPLVTSAERCYSVWNSPGSPEDSIDRQFNVKSLGVDNDGILGQRHVPAECFGKMGSLLLTSVCQSECANVICKLLRAAS